MPQEKMPTRIIVHSKDVENITGLMPRSARRMLENVRKKLGKQKGSLVTIKDFCWYTGIEEELVKDFFKF